jgi:acyl-CoA thioester hydrolase
MNTFLKSYYRVRFPDCDPMNHLNNSRFLDYMLNAREDHLREAYQLTLEELMKKGVFWVVSGHEILYKRPALYNEMVCITSALIGQSEQHLQVEMQMWNEAQTELKAILWSNFTVVDAKTGRKSRHTEEFQEWVRSIWMPGVDVSLGLNDRLAVVVKP